MHAHVILEIVRVSRLSGTTNRGAPLGRHLLSDRSQWGAGGDRGEGHESLKQWHDHNQSPPAPPL
jgi:hypothetical protein